jgi:pantothenate kinase type III
MSDSTPEITLSIDIGSTRTHIAAVDVNELDCLDRIDSDNDDFDTAFTANVKKIADAYPQINRVNISSCVRSLLIKAKETCDDLCIDPRIDSRIDSFIKNGVKRFETVDFVLPHKRLPVAFDYEEPGTLGMDRICDALACAALFKGKSCIIIDVGTAVTVDYLRHGKVFEGVAILSGYSMQLDALHAKTDSLPRIDIGSLGNESTLSLPSKSTEDCIKAGILLGMAGAIDRCISTCKRNWGKGIIVATGGGWASIKPSIKHKTITIPDLTLIGAGIYR